MLFRSDREKLQDLEEEQEELNGSLLALTSHFAQVDLHLHVFQCLAFSHLGRGWRHFPLNFKCFVQQYFFSLAEILVGIIIFSVNYWFYLPVILLLLLEEEM